MLKKSFTAAAIKKAIELLAAECFGALQACNSIGGAQTAEWEILHNNTWKEIVDEGISIGLDFSKMKCAVTDTPLEDSANIQFALGLIDENTRKQIFYRHVKTEGKWPAKKI